MRINLFNYLLLFVVVIFSSCAQQEIINSDLVTPDAATDLESFRMVTFYDTEETYTIEEVVTDEALYQRCKDAVFTYIIPLEAFSAKENVEELYRGDVVLFYDKETADKYVEAYERVNNLTYTEENVPESGEIESRSCGRTDYRFKLTLYEHYNQSGTSITYGWFTRHFTVKLRTDIPSWFNDRASSIRYETDPSYTCSQRPRKMRLRSYQGYNLQGNYRQHLKQVWQFPDR